MAVFDLRGHPPQREFAPRLGNRAKSDISAHSGTRVHPETEEASGY